MAYWIARWKRERGAAVPVPVGWQKSNGAQERDRAVQQTRNKPGKHLGFLAKVRAAVHTRCPQKTNNQGLDRVPRFAGARRLPAGCSS